jgi:hypothetical protein
MKSEISFRNWRVINMILVIVGILLPWFSLGFEVAPISSVPGWEFNYTSFSFVAESLLENNFLLIDIPFAIIAIGGGLLILYLIYNLLEIINEKDLIRRSITLASLISVSLIFLFSVLLLGERPLLGYWLFILGVASCIMLEWVKGIKYYSE